MGYGGWEWAGGRGSGGFCGTMGIIRGLHDTPAGYCHLMWEGCSSFECTRVALRAGSHPADGHLRTPSRHQALRICAAIAGRDGGASKKGNRVMTTQAKPRPLPPLGEVRSYPVLRSEERRVGKECR